MSTGTTTTTTTGTTSTPTSNTLRWGDTGEAVKTLQENLNALKYPCGKADGIYGAKTAEAVKQFQRAKNLTADGIAGPLTFAALKSALCRTRSCRWAPHDKGKPSAPGARHC